MEQAQAQNETAAIDEFAAMTLAQVSTFEENLFEVTRDAITMGVQPIATAIACARNIGRVAMVIANHKEMGKEEWQEMVGHLFNSVIGEMAESYDDMIAALREFIKDDEEKEVA